jgi:hypothetical protein
MPSMELLLKAMQTKDLPLVASIKHLYYSSEIEKATWIAFA